MYIDNKEVKDLARQTNDQIAVVGNRVYDASALVPSLVHFTRQQYLFLQTYRLGVPLEEAAAKARMTAEEADRFLSKEKTVAWLQDRATKDHIRNEWAEGGKWWEMGNDCLEGKKHLSKDQQVVFMAFGERVCPKPRANENETGKTVINFNFSPESVKRAMDRQKSIDAEMEDNP